MNEITYTDKVALNENASIPDINKVKANDMNEIKSVVNGNSQISSNNFGLGTNTWASSATYSIGDIVVYNSNTYKNLTGTNTNITPDQDSTNWEVIPLIVNEKSDSTKNAYSCDYVNTQLDNKANKGQVLWTNPNPTSSFAAQILNIDLSDYDVIEIYFKRDINAEMQSVKTTISDAVMALSAFLYVTGSGDCMVVRNTRIANSIIAFESAYALGIGKNASADENNSCVIPVKIIGYKTGLFS